LRGGDSCQEAPLSYTVVLGGLGGRLDHTLASLSALHKHARSDCNRKIVMLSPTDLCFVLSASAGSACAKGAAAGAAAEPMADHRIEPDCRFEGPGCGLVPLDGATTGVQSTGLKWNLDGVDLAFGSMISSSNETVPVGQGLTPLVTVRTDKALLWTSTLRREFFQ
jgi:thiamine pyrophosphokinase